MQVLVAPVSGGSFPHQLAALRLLSEMGYRPPLALGSSGGQLSIYLVMAAHWEPNAINRVVRSLNSKHMVRSWFPSIMNFMPSVIAGIFTGAAYRTSDDVYTMFEAYFTPETIVETEVWNGAINRDTGAVRLFCNRPLEMALVKGNYYRKRMFKSMPLCYLGGNVREICLSSLASSAVPLVFEAQVYRESSYIDCGTKFASPLVPLQDELRALRDREGGLHIIYVNGYNVEEDYSHDRIPVDIVSNGVSVTAHVIRGFVLHDRMTAYELIQGDCGRDSHYVDVCSVRGLRAVYPLLRKSNGSLLEIYSRDKSTIDYTNFTGEDVVAIMNKSQGQLAGHLWWTGDPHLFDGIGDVVPPRGDECITFQPRCQL